MLTSHISPATGLLDKIWYGMALCTIISWETSPPLAFGPWQEMSFQLRVGGLKHFACWWKEQQITSYILPYIFIFLWNFFNIFVDFILYIYIYFLTFFDFFRKEKKGKKSQKMERKNTKKWLNRSFHWIFIVMGFNCP